MKVVGGFPNAFLFVAPATLVLSSAQNPRLVLAKDHSIFRGKVLSRNYLSKFIICSILKQKEGGRCREQSGFLDQEVFGEKVRGMLGVAARRPIFHGVDFAAKLSGTQRRSMFNHLF